MELYTLIGLVLATPPSALALRELLKEGKAEEVQLSAPGQPVKRIKLPELTKAVHPVRPKEITLEEKRDMLAGYGDGDQIETAGRIMLRKSSLFQTASGTKLPILGAPEAMQPGQLVEIQAEVQKSGREIGILIHQFRDLDDP